jgi:hypothetical protein
MLCTNSARTSAMLRPYCVGTCRLLVCSTPTFNGVRTPPAVKAEGGVGVCLRQKPARAPSIFYAANFSSQIFPGEGHLQLSTH